ncbi:hypothetical protein D9758_012430 [Tetrapyrgos nigripes]|uniref:NADH:flavin oxidoreductase/NADH oxidase N-terminal domain-containing protein n=1 Tax=Tetrapyrgos nigripes TaxID=182062 RepID=A0A8H5FZF8_9AGAR|nr:hypothetical protein D9758_012430 [Tetrapyrgos nigripes]
MLISTGMPPLSLFTPIKVGRCSALQHAHQVILAPLTRVISTRQTNIPQNPMMEDYYSQRGNIPGTLLITEATFVAKRVEAGGYENVPGTYSDEQISAWKELWALGRTADVQTLKELDPSFDLVSASDIPLCAKPEPRPRPLTKDEINEFVLYCDVSNKRNDEYGGSVENRCRFALEVIDAVVNAVGEEKTGLRIGPWTTFQGEFPGSKIALSHELTPARRIILTNIGMKDPIPTFSYLISEIKSRYKDFAYIHAIESAVKGDRSKSDPGSEVNQSNDFVRDIWLPRPMISAGNYDRETALKQAERSKATKEGQLIAFGRHFISNPDFPKRFEKKHSHDTIRQIDLLS